MQAQALHGWCQNDGDKSPVTATFVPSGATLTHPPQAPSHTSPRTMPTASDNAEDSGQDRSNTFDRSRQDTAWRERFENLQRESLVHAAHARVLVLSINPSMGFANRFFALASAMAIAHADQRVLILEWPADAAPRIHPNGERSLMPKLATLLRLPSIPDLKDPSVPPVLPCPNKPSAPQPHSFPRGSSACLSCALP